MALVMVVTRDVADRFHGFLASVMLEVAPNVFVAPRMNKGVRERTWGVVSDWHGQEPRGSLVMVWRDLNEIGGIGLAHGEVGFDGTHPLDKEAHGLVLG